MAADYLLINLAVGLGIAADAMVVTIARFASFRNRRSALAWASAIGVTHWFFPLIGFIGGWYLTREQFWAGFVYTVGGLIMTWLIFSLVTRNPDWVDAGESPQVLFDRPGVFLAAVWGVSIDAFASGPGKTAATASWSEEEVWVSFLLVGVVVFALVLVAAGLAMHLNSTYRRGLRGFNIDKLRSRLCRWFLVGTWTEVAIFTYFGTLAYVEAMRTFTGLVPRWSAVPISLLFFATLLLSFRSRVRLVESVRASAAANEVHRKK